MKFHRILVTNDRHTHFIALHFIAFHSCCIFVVVAFLQTEGNTLHQQKDYDSVYCDSCFIVEF